MAKQAVREGREDNSCYLEMMINKGMAVLLYSFVASVASAVKRIRKIFAHCF